MSVLYIIKMNCREATYLHERRREKQLSTTEKIALKVHLLWCKVCTLFYQQMDGLEKCAHDSHQHNKLNNTMPDEAKLRIQRALDKEMQ